MHHLNIFIYYFVLLAQWSLSIYLCVMLNMEEIVMKDEGNAEIILKMNKEIFIYEFLLFRILLTLI